VIRNSATGMNTIVKRMPVRRCVSVFPGATSTAPCKPIWARQLVASGADQVLASPSPAIRIGNGSMPPAETLAVTSPAAGTLCPLCQKQFPKLLSEYNLKEHQKSKTCKREQTADPSSKPDLLSAFNAPSPLPLSTTASADEFKELSRAAAPSSSRAAEETAESRKRKSKKAGKAKTLENKKKAKQEMRRQAEVEWTGLDDKREARLVELRQKAAHDPDLLEAICDDNKACVDPTCPWLHQCTRTGKDRWECQKEVRGEPSTSSKPGHNPRQLRCMEHRSLNRAYLKVHHAGMTTEQRRAKEAKRKKGANGPGTANPIEVFEAAFTYLAPTIRNQPDWILLDETDANRMSPRELFLFDVEFGSTNADLVAPSQWGNLILLEACVIRFQPPGAIVLYGLVNFVPPDYEHGPIDYLKEQLPKNWRRLLKSVGRVHHMPNLDDTPQCNSNLQRRLTACKPIAQMTAELAAVARQVKEEGAAFAGHGHSPEPLILESLSRLLGEEEFPRSPFLNSQMILETIARQARSQSPKTDEPSTKVPCGLAEAYYAITGSELEGSHTATGDCRGMAVVLKRVQQCRKRCEQDTPCTSSCTL
jgi:hypothetical protein